LEQGLVGRAFVEVEFSDSAAAIGSGDVPVLGTPRVVALVEEATVNAVESHLEDGQTTVGTRVELDHVAPTPIGRMVRADAELVAVDGRSLRFAVVAHDGFNEIATGVVHRAVVDRTKFLSRLNS
jgi:fluoroacetyl-CoA thioesterase